MTQVVILHLMFLLVVTDFVVSHHASLMCFPRFRDECKVAFIYFIVPQEVLRINELMNSGN